MAVDNNRGPTIGLWNIIASCLILIMSSSAYLLVEEVKICLYNFEVRSEIVPKSNYEPR